MPGGRTPPSALPSRKCSKPAAPDAFNTEDAAGELAADESYESGECGGTDAPFDPALAEMLEARYAGRCARVYTKIADAFNTEDAAGELAADESYESGE